MENIMYDYSKLKGKVREVFRTNEAYASFLGISEASLYEKYKSESYFNQNQIDKSMHKFNEGPEMIPAYFFTKKVEKNSTMEESE